MVRASTSNFIPKTYAVGCKSGEKRRLARSELLELKAFRALSMPVRPTGTGQHNPGETEAMGARSLELDPSHRCFAAFV
jgi:hypothetical protein